MEAQWTKYVQRCRNKKVRSYIYNGLLLQLHIESETHIWLRAHPYIYMLYMLKHIGTNGTNMLCLLILNFDFILKNIPRSTSYPRQSRHKASSRFLWNLCPGSQRSDRRQGTSNSILYICVAAVGNPIIWSNI